MTQTHLTLHFRKRQFEFNTIYSWRREHPLIITKLSVRQELNKIQITLT